LPSFVTAFHSCIKESSPLIDKVCNIVDKSQKPEVSLFQGEWVAMVLEARCRFEDSFGRPPSVEDGIVNFLWKKPENFWQMDRPWNPHILWVSNTKSVCDCPKMVLFQVFRSSPTITQGFWQESNMIRQSDNHPLSWEEVCNKKRWERAPLRWFLQYSTHRNFTRTDWFQLVQVCLSTSHRQRDENCWCCCYYQHSDMTS
jgi:hypothetical protein